LRQQTSCKRPAKKQQKKAKLEKAMLRGIDGVLSFAPSQRLEELVVVFNDSIIVAINSIEH
jgi:hypothetical protein